MKRNQGKKTMRFFTSLLLCGLLLSGCGGDIQSGDYSGRLSLSVRGERLSAKIQGVPLEIVLSELARQAQVKVSVADSVKGELVSAEFENLSLEQGIRRILYSKDYALVYSDQPASRRGHGGPTVMEIHVVGAKVNLTPQSNMPSTASGWSGGARVIEMDSGQDGDAPTTASRLVAVNTADLRARHEAVEALIAVEDDMAVDMLGQLALTDEEVRDTAITTLAGMASSKALSKLGQILGDSRPDVKRSAVEAIASIGDEQALMLLRGSLGDADPGVQAVAASALNMLE